MATIQELESFKLSDAVSFHKELNPKLWEDEKLDPEVRDQLLLIAEDFVEYLGISNLKVRDVTISGSNAAYSYTPHSDLDLHVLVDFNELPNNEVYQELFTAKKTLYNDAHDITVRDVPVELYVQDTSNPVQSLGEYSVVHDKWIRIPKKRRANFDQAATKLKYEKLGELIELALKTRDPKRVNDTIALVKRYRKSGLDKAGEFGPENLAYKAVRKQGLVQALHDLKVQLHTEKLSIDEYANEDYDPNGPPPGPEFKPTMPAGTVRVDVSDVYDWYKLGQHVSNLKGLGKHDFGKGPPSTILSFGDEETEHKYIQDLEKTGLTTTDIDPVDPNQPKGMKRQKTDPTFNVNETDDRKAAVLKIQKHLNKKYGANLDLDGKLGPLTLKSINKFMPRAKTGLADEPNKTTAVQGKKLKEASAKPITEYRDKMYQYIKNVLPNWPDYVLKDWIYNLARGEHQAGGGRKRSSSDKFLWGFNKETILAMIAGEGLSPDTKWQLIPDLKFTMDMFTPNTKKFLIARAGGKSTELAPVTMDPASRDAERHDTQARLAKQQGGVRKEPVLLVKKSDGYELLEGWHRTIQHFAMNPGGYVGPAYVAVQGKKLKEAKIDAHRQGDTIWINYFEVPEKGKGLGTQEYMKFEKSLPKDIKKIRLVASDAGYGPTHEFWDRMGFDYAYPDDDNEMVKLLEASGTHLVYRVDKTKIPDFEKNLKTYYHNDDWSMSGSKWEGATGSAKGLYAHPDKLFVALYAAGTPETNRYVATYNTSPPMVYFDKKDVSKFKNTKSYLTAFDASTFKKVPSGEVFSDMPGKPVHQIEITDPFKFIKQQGWGIKLVDDLPAKLKEIKKIAKEKNIKYGAEGMDMDLKEASDYSQYESKIEDFVQSLNPDDVGVEQLGPYHVHFEGFTDECQQDAERRCNLPSDNPQHLTSYDDVYKEVIRDFVRREGGKKPLKVGFAGYQDYPVIYAVFDNPEPYKNPDAWNPKIDESVKFKVQKGKTKFSTELLVSNEPAGIYQYDATTGRSIAEVYPEFKGKGLGKLLVLHAIYTAAQLGLDFIEDDSRTAEYDNVLDSLSSNGYIVDDDGYWYVTGDGENYLKQSLNEASGYIPSAKEKNDPRFKTALTVDVKPDAIKKNAKAFGFKTSRAGIPPQARADGKIAEDLMREFKTFLGEQQEEMFPGYDEQHREKRLGNWLAKSWGVQNGKPQTFYHATTKDFDTFNTSGTGFASALGMAYEVERHGSFFAVDPKFAEGFIEDPNTGRVKEGGRVLPVHLSIQSPIDLRDDALSRMLSDEETVEEFKANDIDLRSIYNHFYELERWELFDGPEGAEFIDNLQNLGFDGAIINEAIPNNSNAKSGQVWVAFSPNQVKSVYNRGSFSPDDPRLTKESG